MVAITIALALALLIAANALYVAGEFAAVAVPQPRIRALAEEHAGARRLQPIIEDPKRLDHYIAGCQIGITLSSLLLGAYGQKTLAPPLARALGELGGWEAAAAQSMAFVVILLILTVAQMVLGELVPKALALQFPDRAALATAPPIGWSLRIFAPLIWILNGSGMALLRLLGVKRPTERHVQSPAEIDILLSEGDRVGLDANARRRLRRALRLSSRSARELMVPRHRIVAIEENAPLGQLARIASERPYTRFPVFQGDIDHPVGMLHTKDVVCARARKQNRSISELLRPTVTVPLDASAETALVTMRERRAAQALVVDARGRVAGLVTLGDVMREVFGALADEFKSGPPRRRRR